MPTKVKIHYTKNFKLSTFHLLHFILFFEPSAATADQEAQGIQPYLTKSFVTLLHAVYFGSVMFLKDHSAQIFDER